MLMIMKGYVDICTPVKTQNQFSRSVTRPQQICQLGPGTILNEPNVFQRETWTATVASDFVVCLRVSYDELSTTLSECAPEIERAASSRNQRLDSELNRKYLINASSAKQDEVLVDAKFCRWSQYASKHLFAQFETEFCKQTESKKVEKKALANDLTRVKRVDPDLCIQISTPHRARRFTQVRKSLPANSFAKTQNRITLMSKTN